MLRKIRTFDDPVLRKKCHPVKAIDKNIRKLLDEMAETLHHTPNSAGLAACQVGVLKRLVVIDVGEGLLKLVNPVIIEAEGEQIVVEGCLSFPEIWGKVKRPKVVVVEALNERGEKVIIRADEELLTKCLCHEIDHLDGVVLPDHVLEYV